MKKLITLFLLFFPLCSISAKANLESDNAIDEYRKITVEINIEQSLMPKNSDEWILYVYAVKPKTRLPLASFKGKLSQLPATIILDESMYLLPHLTLKQAESVVIIAKATTNIDPHQRSDEDLIGYSPVINFSLTAKQQSKITIADYDINLKK